MPTFILKACSPSLSTTKTSGLGCSSRVLLSFSFCHAAFFPVGGPLRPVRKLRTGSFGRLDGSKGRLRLAIRGDALGKGSRNGAERTRLQWYGRSLAGPSLVSVAVDFSVAGWNRTGYQLGNIGGTGMDTDSETLRGLKALAEEIDTLRHDEFAAGFSALAARIQVEQAVEGGYSDTEFAASYREKIVKGLARKETLASIRQRLEKVGRALETDAAALTAERAAYAHAIAAVSQIEYPTEPVEIPDNAPLKLEQAVRLPELAGVLSVKTLRSAISAGRLHVLRPNSKNLFTTRRFIREWLESCQGQESPLTSSSGAPARTSKAGSPTEPSTSSKTALTNTARDAALTILQGLKKPSTTTSFRNTRKR